MTRVLLCSVGTTGYAYVSNMATAPKRYLAYLATFSRMATVCQVYDFLCERLHFRPEDMRLWFYRDEVKYTFLSYMWILSFSILGVWIKNYL